MEKLKHSELKTIEEYKEYKRQIARDYYKKNSEKIRARRKQRYYDHEQKSKQDEK